MTSGPSSDTPQYCAGPVPGLSGVIVLELKLISVRNGFRCPYEARVSTVGTGREEPQGSCDEAAAVDAAPENSRGAEQNPAPFVPRAAPVGAVESLGAGGGGPYPGSPCRQPIRPPGFMRVSVGCSEEARAGSILFDWTPARRQTCDRLWCRGLQGQPTMDP
jgi:hypothetical protein